MGIGGDTDIVPNRASYRSSHLRWQVWLFKHHGRCVPCVTAIISAVMLTAIGWLFITHIIPDLARYERRYWEWAEKEK